MISFDEVGMVPTSLATKLPNQTVAFSSCLAAPKFSYEKTRNLGKIIQISLNFTANRCQNWDLSTFLKLQPTRNTALVRQYGQ